MAEATVAPHVDHDVALEALAELDRHLGGEGDRLRIVAVDMEDRRLDALGDVARIGRRPCELRAGREADLVVDDVMQAPAGIVAADAGKAEALPHDPLPRERRVAVDQHGQCAAMIVQILLDRLDRARLPEHDGIDRFEVRGVGNQRHMDADAFEIAVGAGAEVIFDVARSADILRDCPIRRRIRERSRGTASP